MTDKWMIYGANGYTGKLIATEAQKRGFRPVLGGRNQHAIRALATDLDLEWRSFDAVDPQVVAHQLHDIDLVLNCAGPFTATINTFLAACLQSQTHYLDISGELEVFEKCFRDNAKAKDKGILLCPGVAFDIFPTESVAAKLKMLLPDAHSIKLGFDGKMELSGGSTLTLLDGIGNPGLGVFMVREHGRLLSLSRPKSEKLRFQHRAKSKPAMAITWADLNGAFYSTQVENIAVYIPATIVNRMSFAMMHALKPLFEWKSVRKVLGNIIATLMTGPSLRQLERGAMTVCGVAENPLGQRVEVFLNLPHGYRFTCLAALALVEAALKTTGAAGYFTPSMLVGPDFVQSIEGCSDYKIVRGS